MGRVVERDQPQLAGARAGGLSTLGAAVRHGADRRRSPAALDRGLQLRRRALRPRGSLLARRRAAVRRRLRPRRAWPSARATEPASRSRPAVPCHCPPTSRWRRTRCACARTADRGRDGLGSSGGRLQPPGDEWDRTEEREGWRSKDAFVGRRLGAELLGGSSTCRAGRPTVAVPRAPRKRGWRRRHRHADTSLAGRGAGTPRRRCGLLPARPRRRTSDLEPHRLARSRADALDAPRAGDRRVSRHRQGRNERRQGSVHPPGQARAAGRDGRTSDDRRPRPRRPRAARGGGRGRPRIERACRWPERSLACGPEAGRLLFALVAPNAGCSVLEVGASRGYSTIWLAAAARLAGGHVVSLEREPAKIDAWRRNLADAGLHGLGGARRGRRLRRRSRASSPASRWSSSMRGRTTTSGTSRSQGRSSAPAASSWRTTPTRIRRGAAYVRARQADPTLVSVHAADRQRARGDAIGTGAVGQRPEQGFADVTACRIGTSCRRLPRKGGGPDVTDSSSTGSGGTSG